nr:VRR-NUC domain-containing protein [uncultured Holophaga sp.]
MLERGYCLANLETLLAEVERRSGDLLHPPERDRLEAFRALPLPARHLLARMLTRKGPWLRGDTLAYPEVGEPGPALAHLVAAGFCLGPDQADGDALLPLLTRAELATQLRGLGVSFPRATRRESLALLLREHPEALPDLRASLAPHRVAEPEFWRLLEVLFFGNLEQDLSSFVVADLGHLRYPDYPLDPSARRFGTRAEVDFLRSVQALREALEAGNLDLDALTAQALALRPAHSQRRHQGLLNGLGRAWERLGRFPEALACFEASGRPPARERRVRIHAAQGDLATACALALEMAQSPLDLGEARFVRVFLHKQRKERLEALLWLEANPAPPPVPELRLVLEPRGLPVEEAVLESARGQGWEGFFAENHLWRALFGLVFWDELFADVPGAFQHRYQTAPLDLDRFQEARRERVAARLAGLEAPGALERLVLGNAHHHRGEACSFVSWKHLEPAHLEAVVRRIPPAVLRSVLSTLAPSPRAFDSGFPDLFLYRPESSAWALWEVKGPGDSLRPEQSFWLERFGALGCEARVARVTYWDGLF